MKKYYHGTHFNFKNGFELIPQNVFSGSKEVSELENLFELYRPSDKIPRSKSVFISDNIDMIDNLGGYTDAIYEVIPDIVEQSDLAWYTEAELAIEDSNLNKAIDCIHNYWNGSPFYDSDYSCFEYRTNKATIINLIELNVDKKELTCLKTKSKKYKP